MKKTSIVIFIIGLLISVFFWSPLPLLITGDGLGGGFGAIFIGYPLILLGVTLFIISLFRHNN